jgi:hypothetical protein
MLRWTARHGRCVDCVAPRFPDGQLYVNLRGFDPTGPPLDPAEAIRGFLDALGVPVERIPASLQAQSGLLRSLLAGKRVLVLLDNAAASSEPEAVDDLIARCARLPLALTIAAARAAAHPGFPLATLSAELREATGALDALHGGDPATDVRAVFSWSYRTLSADAARMFRLLGLHPGPDISAAAASLAGIPPQQARAPLTELANAHLLTERTPGRYSFHDLLSAYAAEQVHSGESDHARRAAVRRVLDHYLAGAVAAVDVLFPAGHRRRRPDLVAAVSLEPARARRGSTPSAATLSPPRRTPPGTAGPSTPSSSPRRWRAIWTPATSAPRR